jgi:hypothetical protein
MNFHDFSHQAEHDFANTFGFYRAQLWWIDSFTIRRGNWYKFAIVGRNDMHGGEPIGWQVPKIAERPYAFALKPIN